MHFPCIFSINSFRRRSEYVARSQKSNLILFRFAQRLKSTRRANEWKRFPIYRHSKQFFGFISTIDWQFRIAFESYALIQLCSIWSNYRRCVRSRIWGQLINNLCAMRMFHNVEWNIQIKSDPNMFSQIQYVLILLRERFVISCAIES